MLESVSLKSASPENFPQLSKFNKKEVEYFFASGGRSANGIFSSMVGLPDRNGRSVLRSADAITRYGTLGNVLGQRKIPSYFFYSTDLEFDHIERFLIGNGFSQVYGRPEMGASDDCQAAAFVAKRIREYQARDKIFLAVYYSINSHHPYIAPEPYLAQKGEPYLASLLYTDACLSPLVQKFQNEKIAIILTSDHSEHHTLDVLEDRLLPFWLFETGIALNKRLRPGPASQLDIVPTILELAGGNFFHHALGQSLWNGPGQIEPFAMSSGGSGHQVLAWAENDRLLLTWPWIKNEKYRHSLLHLKRPFHPENLAMEQKDVSERLALYARSAYSVARFLEAANRLYPAQKDVVQSRPKKL